MLGHDGRDPQGHVTGGVVGRTQRHHAAQADLLERVDRAEAGVGSGVHVAELVVDGGDAAGEELDGLHPGAGTGHVPVEVQRGGDDDRRRPLEQGEGLTHSRDQPLGEVGVGVDQARGDDAVGVSDHDGRGVGGAQVGPRTDGGDQIVHDEHGAVADVALRSHRQDVAGPDEGGRGHVRRLLRRPTGPRTGPRSPSRRPRRPAATSATSGRPAGPLRRAVASPPRAGRRSAVSSPRRSGGRPRPRAECHL